MLCFDSPFRFHGPAQTERRRNDDVRFVKAVEETQLVLGECDSESEVVVGVAAEERVEVA